MKVRVLCAALLVVFFGPLFAGGAGEAPMPSDDPKASGFDLTSMAPGVLAFTTEASAKEMAKSKKVLYFFAATWCPSCQSTYRDLKANHARIPSDMVILVVNYDKYPDLKTKYGIVQQHSWVQLDSMGGKAKTWTGSMDTDAIVAMAMK